MNKSIINKKALAALAMEPNAVKRYFTTPTPLNNLLWFAVAQTDSGFYTGYFSVFDKGIEKMHFVNRRQNLIPQNNKDISLLRQFSEDYYSMEQ